MIRDLVKGAVSGTIATAAHTVVMMTGSRAGRSWKPPPKHIVRAVLPGSKHRPKHGENVLATVAHVGFGAAAGGLFAIPFRRRRPRVAEGMAYGLAIWLVSYQGWVPGLGAMPPAHRDRPDRQAVLAAAHVTYGAALVLALNALRRDEGRPAETGPVSRERPLTPTGR
ncbi:hypothetical protein ABZT47_23255 [Sphaerisporangium sp. NPDC005289]|uniref:DUF6789 family protein n=1 Tax=Sphaerisporangium sp. NPDC005289 TaxID=3155247 RepID=UPI0033BBC55F